MKGLKGLLQQGCINLQLNKGTSIPARTKNSNPLLTELSRNIPASSNNLPLSISNQNTTVQLRPLRELKTTPPRHTDSRSRVRNISVQGLNRPKPLYNNKTEADNRPIHLLQRLGLNVRILFLPTPTGKVRHRAGQISIPKQTQQGTIRRQEQLHPVRIAIQPPPGRTLTLLHLGQTAILLLPDPAIAPIQLLPGLQGVPEGEALAGDASNDSILTLNL